MTDEIPPEAREVRRVYPPEARDPILRLDQFIHRQDEMIRLLKLQCEIAKAMAFAVGLLVFIGMIFIVYLIWK